MSAMLAAAICVGRSRRLMRLTISRNDHWVSSASDALVESGSLAAIGVAGAAFRLAAAGAFFAAGRAAGRLAGLRLLGVVFFAGGRRLDGSLRLIGLVADR